MKRFILLLVAFIVLPLLFLQLLGVVATHTGAPEPGQEKASAVTPQKTAKQMQQEITSDGLFLAINKARTQNSVSPLSHNPTLDKSAADKCTDLAKGNYYAHKNPVTGKQGYTYVASEGVSYSYASENLDLGYFSTASDVVSSWMNSESHRAAIVDPGYTETGFATCIIPTYKDQLAVVMHLIKPAKEQPVTKVENHYIHESTPVYSPTYTSCHSYDSWYSYGTNTYCTSY